MIQRKYTDRYLSVFRISDQTAKVYVLTLCAVPLFGGVSFELELCAIHPCVTLYSFYPLPISTVYDNGIS
jgi:hypothetical protein